MSCFPNRRKSISSPYWQGNSRVLGTIQAGLDERQIAAVRCALMCVLSIMMVSPSAPRWASSTKIRAKTPIRDQ